MKIPKSPPARGEVSGSLLLSVSSLEARGEFLDLRCANGLLDAVGSTEPDLKYVS